MECNRCGYKASKKCNLLQHLRRKKPCSPTLSDMDRDEYINQLLGKAYNNSTYDCEICGRRFNTRQGKSRHKRICQPEEPSTSDENAKIVMNNCCNVTNNITNHVTNINIKDFKHVDGQHISSDVLVNLIKRIKSTDVYYDVFQTVLELIYFDKAHPENHCLLIPNIRNNLCRIIKNGQPKYEKRRVVTDLAINETHNTLHDTYEEAPHDYSIMTKQTMNTMDEKYQQNNKEHMKAVRDKTDIAILNHKDMILSTWKEQCV